MAGRHLIEQQGGDVLASAEKKTISAFPARMEKRDVCIFEEGNQKGETTVIGNRLNIGETYKDASAFSGADNDTNGRGFLFHI